MATSVEGVRLIDYPAPGVEVGEGWSTQRGLGTGGSCLVFRVVNDQPGQAASMESREVFDQSEVSQVLEISAETTVRGLFASGSAKAEYAESLKVNTTFSSFALLATVDNGWQRATYPQAASPGGIVATAAVPAELVRRRPDLESGDLWKRTLALADRSLDRPAAAVPARWTAPASAGGCSDQELAEFEPPAQRLALNARAACLAARRPLQFYRECGDHFVRAIRSGAQLVAFFTVKTVDVAQKQKIAGEMTISSPNVDLAASINKVTSAVSSNTTTELRFTRFGGRGEPLPQTMSELRQAARELPRAAVAGPYRHSVLLDRYDQLPNWPPVRQLNPNLRGLREIAETFGRTDALFHTVTDMLERTPEIGGGDFLLGRGVRRPDLLTLQADLQARASRLERLAATCMSEAAAEANVLATGSGSCALPAELRLDDRAIRLGLPLPFADPRLPYELYLSDRDLGDRIFEYWFGRRNRYFCSQKSPDRSQCVAELHLPPIRQRVRVSPAAVGLIGDGDLCLTSAASGVPAGAGTFPCRGTGRTPGPGLVREFRFDRSSGRVRSDDDRCLAVVPRLTGGAPFAYDIQLVRCRGKTSVKLPDGRSIEVGPTNFNAEPTTAGFLLKANVHCLTRDSAPASSRPPPLLLTTCQTRLLTRQRWRIGILPPLLPRGK